uniref:Uncharacterized protein n=1 Tax=Cannabis sativa TaxID=3483 RepID=A0A803QPL4_CANSA
MIQNPMVTGPDVQQQREFQEWIDRQTQIMRAQQEEINCHSREFGDRSEQRRFTQQTRGKYRKSSRIDQSTGRKNIQPDMYGHPGRMDNLVPIPVIIPLSPQRMSKFFLVKLTRFPAGRHMAFPSQGYSKQSLVQGPTKTIGQNY